MRIAIVGGTGTVGREAAAELARRGHDVRVLSRHAPQWPVDLTDGSGLDAALERVDVVVSAANGGRPLLVDGTARLLRAAPEAHHVVASVVGAERVPLGYNGHKLAQEKLVRNSGVPFTIVRATQFHGYVAGFLARAARFGVLPVAPLPLQPVDPREVGRVLADSAEAEPSGAVTQFAGPEVLSLRELVEVWRRETGSRALALSLPLPGATGRALRAGALTEPGAWRGSVRFGEWLAA
jgi:uncharacterized protein YbjT (DUF2867 family)